MHPHSQPYTRRPRLLWLVVGGMVASVVALLGVEPALAWWSDVDSAGYGYDQPAPDAGR